MSELFYNARNLIVSNGFLKNPDKYYLEEFFPLRPAVVGGLAAASANKTFLVEGTNAVTNSISFSTSVGGIKLTTAGSASDQVIISPHSSANQSAWYNIKWGTENEVEWECALSVDSVSDVCFWAGLKISNTPVLNTDANQAYFFFDTSTLVGSGSSMTSQSTLHFCYSVNNIDYVTNLGITAEANNTYRLRIVFDNNRKLSVFVNEVQYGLTTTTSTTGNVVSNETQKSNQLLAVDLLPFVGIQQTTGTAKVLNLSYEKISRNI